MTVLDVMKRLATNAISTITLGGKDGSGMAVSRCGVVLANHSELTTDLIVKKQSLPYCGPTA